MISRMSISQWNGIRVFLMALVSSEKKNQLVILPNVLGVNQSILGIPAKHESIDFPIGLDTSHVRHTCASQLVQQWGGIPQNGNFHEDDDDKSINSLAF